MWALLMYRHQDEYLQSKGNAICDTAVFVPDKHSSSMRSFKRAAR